MHNQDKCLHQTKKAKHKVPEVLSNSNPTQKRKATKGKNKNERNTNGKQGVKSNNTRKRPHIEISDSDSDDTDSDDDLFGNVPKDVEEQKLATNPPCIVLMNALIQKCSGCHFRYTAPERWWPWDMVFRYLMYRLKPDGKGKMEPDTKRTPAYFHTRDLACLPHLEELKNIEMDDIYIYIYIYIYIIIYIYIYIYKANGAIVTLACLHIILLKKQKCGIH